MSSNPPAISINGASKAYRMFNRPEDRLRQILFGRWKQHYREFWALKDVSFQVPSGVTIGIIGKNGSGKSTLLQMICGTLTPTQGSIECRGRISALLELGTGFNPEFSGKENVFLNASILGLSQEEIKDRYNDIVAFADIGDFIHQPVKTYSSGMYVRLAFSIAIHVDPHILIVDEALAVGDVKFQAKCFRKLQDLRAGGTTILFVSHSPEEIVRHCDTAILLDEGRLIAQGAPRDVVNKYLDLVFGVSSESQELEKTTPAGPNIAQGNLNTSEDAEPTDLFDNADKHILSQAALGNDFAKRPGYNPSEYRWGNGDAQIVDFCLFSDGKTGSNHLESKSQIDILVRVAFQSDISHPIYGLTIKTPDGVTVYGTNSRDWNNEGDYVPQRRGDSAIVRFKFPLNLVSGSYLISLGVAADKNGDIVPLDRRYDCIEIYAFNARKCFGIIDLGMSFAKVA